MACEEAACAKTYSVVVGKEITPELWLLLTTKAAGSTVRHRDQWRDTYRTERKLRKAVQILFVGSELYFFYTIETADDELRTAAHELKAS